MASTPRGCMLQHEQDPRQRRPVRHPGPSALGLRRLRREQRRDPRPQRIRQQFLRHGTLLHDSYSASLAPYATVLLGVLSPLLHIFLWVEALRSFRVLLLLCPERVKLLIG